jgi:solute carrier family 50 (sugar transporter)
MGLLLEHLVPALGVLVANALFFSPLKPVLQARSGRGSFSSAAPPLVFAAMSANCSAWLVYSFLKRDPYILASNVLGALVSQYMLLATVAGTTVQGAADAGTRAALFFSAVLIASGAGVAFSSSSSTSTPTDDPAAAAAAAWGWVTVAILLVFYASPLSTLARVLRSRNASSLQLPFATMNAINGALWAAYGLAVSDAFVWAPNVVGCLFGLVQVALCLVYPPTPGAGNSGGLLPSSTGGEGGFEEGGGGSVGLVSSRPGSSSAVGAGGAA